MPLIKPFVGCAGGQQCPLHNGEDEMFGQQFHLQNTHFFPIGQSRSALALFVVSGIKVSMFTLRY